MSSKIAPPEGGQAAEAAAVSVEKGSCLSPDKPCLTSQQDNAAGAGHGARCHCQQDSQTLSWAVGQDDLQQHRQQLIKEDFFPQGYINQKIHLTAPKCGWFKGLYS